MARRTGTAQRDDARPASKHWWEPIELWFNRAQSFHGFVLAVFGTFVSTYFGITGDFPPYLILTISVFTLVLVTLAYSFAANRLWRSILIVGILAASAITTLYTMHIQHKHERRAYFDYYPTYAGMALDVDITPPAEGPRAEVRGITLALTFDNPNAFPVWMKSVRRYVTVAGKSSGDEQDIAIARWPEFNRDGRIVDSEIRFAPYLVPEGRVLEGTIDYTVCFGREEGKFDKHFNMKGKLYFPLLGPRVVPYTPDFVPNDDTKKSYGFSEGCPG